MKLLFCYNCAMVFSLSKTYRECNCGQTWGKYLDNREAVYGGAGIPIGFNNIEFLTAMEQQSDTGEGREFSAFVMPKTCRTFTRENDDALAR